MLKQTSFLFCLVLLNAFSELPEKNFKNSIGMELILIPAGEFEMGSPANEKDRDENEVQHTVKITKPFFMSRTEVTQGQYEAVMGKNPSDFKGKDLPVESVSWEEAVEFSKKLSDKERKAYRLPTEAEWEYACRAGTKTIFSFGDSDKNLGDYAWQSGNSTGTTHVVGQKKPNSWGLYDMHGNVWEWCSDWYGDYYSKTIVDPTGPTAGEGRVLRGGSWLSSAGYCRSAFRSGYGPGGRDGILGFRVALPRKDESY
ncbi:MAG: formylglycine-generating enzyme family protein, partial [Planctomycetota bacterium]|nr:formylglycine-generating enzyme family protein [Planctomycetota bacterium]